ncbi:MAG: M20/M25/M40 family metallo-hydrolase [Nitrospinota bacterium]
MPHPAWKSCLRHLTPRRLRDTLMEMVNIPSPTGREKAMARYLVDRLGRSGFRTELQEVSAGRPNAIGARPGAGDGRNLLFTGHMDTSYDGDESYLAGEGFKAKAVHRGGWIWGLGANNMKSGLASALVAVEAVAKEDVPLRGDLTYAGVVGEIEKAPVEEFQGESFAGYGTGSRHLILHGVTSDWVILAEPTGLSVSNANLGVLWAKITARGTVSHSVFTKHPGIRNAIRAIHRIQAAVEKWAARYESRHACMGERPNVTIASIRGGLPWRLSRNPTEASLYLDIRMVPGQSPEDIKRELRALLRKVAEESGGPEAELGFYIYDPGTLLDPAHPFVGAMLKAHKRALGKASPLTIRRPAADSTHFNHYELPCVCYGPGGRMHPGARKRGLMHAVGEHAAVEDLVAAAKVYVAAILEICGQPAARKR